MKNSRNVYQILKKAPVRLPRPCLNCSNIFQPTGKYQKLCYDCYCNRHQKRLELYRIMKKNNALKLEKEIIKKIS